MRPLVFLFFFAFLATAQAQNMGVDEPNPQEKLHVRGSIRTDSALVLHPHTALTPANAITLPNHVSTISISLDDATETDNDLTGPATPIEGQVLTILNEDDDPATFANVEIAPTEGVNVYQYINSSWRLLSKTPVAAGGGGAKVYRNTLTTDVTYTSSSASAGSGNVLTVTFVPENTTAVVQFSASGRVTGGGNPTTLPLAFRLNANGGGFLGFTYSTPTCTSNSLGNPCRFTSNMSITITGLNVGVENTITIGRANFLTSSGTINYVINASTNAGVDYAHLIVTDTAIEP